jgi:hypothetical protein
MRCIKGFGRRLTRPLSRSIVVLAAVPLLFIASCVKEQYDFDKIGGFEWNPDFAVPLVHSRLTLDDVLGQVNPGDLLITDSLTHTMKVVYRGQAFSQTAEELFPQLDQSYDSTFQVLLPPIPNGDSLVISLPISMEFITANGEILDSLWYDAGQFVISLQANINRNMKFRMQVPGLRKSGQPFDVLLPYNFTGPLPITVGNQKDLQGYSCIFNSAAAGIHTLNAILSITVYGDNNPNNSPYSLDVSLKQENLGMAALFGFLGQQVVNIPLDTIQLGLFKSSIGGTFTVDDPRITITFKNSFGLPVAIDVTTLQAYSAINPPYQVSLTGIPNPFFVNAPSYSQIGQATNTSLILNKNTTNISSFISLMPSEVRYAMDATMNPSGTGKNFVLKDSKMDIDFDVEVPLSGTASGFQVKDTIDFAFDRVDEIESIMFKFNILNGFPLDVGMQIYLADSNYQILDSLLLPGEKVISSGVPGPAPDYKVTIPGQKTTEVSLDPGRLENLFQTSYIILKADLATSNGGTTTVKFYSDYYIDVKIGTRVKAKVSSNL